MTTRKKKPEPKGARPGCDLCHGKGWFNTTSGWPAQCHRCFPEAPGITKPKSRPPGPLEAKEYAQHD